MRNSYNLFYVGLSVQALAKERVALQHANAPYNQIEMLERHLVDFLATQCAADLASGHTELAVARLQAALEYNYFAPPIFGDHNRLKCCRMWNLQIEDCTAICNFIRQGHSMWARLTTGMVLYSPMSLL